MIPTAQKRLILSSLERLSCAPIDLMERFYDKLFQLDPDTEALFKGSMFAQYEKLLDMLMLVSHSLDNLDKLVVTIEELGSAHAGFDVKEHHYTYVGEALLFALEHSVTDWTRDDRAAWALLYGYLADLMITGARTGAGTKRAS